MKEVKIYEVLDNLRMDASIRIIEEDGTRLYDALVGDVPFKLEQDFCYGSLFYDSAEHVLVMCVRRKEDK